MRKNVAGQIIAAEMVSSDDGSAFTGTVTVYVTGDGGTQAVGTVGSGVCTHEGNGLHTYLPAQAETNFTHIAFTFIGTGAVPVTIQVYTNLDTQLLDIQSRIPNSLDNGLMKSSVQSMAANTLTASALASDAVSEIAAAVGGGAGSGARTITITVNDGISPLEGAKVRVRQGSENYVQTTNASGIVTFNLDDFTWSVAITKAGYTFTATTLVVNGSTSPPTYSMTLVSLTPSDPDKVTGYWTVLDEEGDPAVGVVVKVNAVLHPTGAEGIIQVKTTRSSTTDSNGVADFANMLPGWTYSVSLDGQTVSQITIDSEATGTVELGSCVLAE